MNYRHAFHAGNFADVMKHAALVLMLRHLARKDTAFRMIDAHAGIGRYNLWGPQASKTGEWVDGIGRLWGKDIPELADYLAIIAADNGGAEALRTYPGSPRIARALLRPQDRLVLVELHPEDAKEVAEEFRGDRQVEIRQMDAYAALKAMLPPPERRGLVLIDPPFEVKDEFQRVQKGLAQALKRWSTGTYAVWYPIKGRAPVDAFLEEVKAFGLPTLVAELLIHDAVRDDRLNGCGLVIIRPPWQLDEALSRLLPLLWRELGKGGGGSRVEWLVGAE